MEKLKVLEGKENFDNEWNRLMEES